jgi:isopentenyl diphosphate isomerase/L-lactate dehydrogenase-like FMN-dependent dehydrogenase
MPVFRGQGTRNEAWQITRTWATQATGTKLYSSVLRNPTGVTVSTASTPFNLPVNEAAGFVDLYVAKAADLGATALSVQLDLDINGVAQRLGLTNDAIQVSNLTRPRVRPITANPGSSLAFFAVNLATAASQVQTEYLITSIIPKGA